MAHSNGWNDVAGSTFSRRCQVVDDKVVTVNEPRLVIMRLGFKKFDNDCYIKSFKLKSYPFLKSSYEMPFVVKVFPKPLFWNIFQYVKMQSSSTIKLSNIS